VMRGEALRALESGHAQVPTAYHDRSRSPAETVALMRPHFAALGITRVAKFTGLDRVGIPCFAAFRPNSRSIASNQGKGVDDDAARASAVMEAVEFAIAERPTSPIIVSSAAQLAKDGTRFADPHKALPLGDALDPDRSIRWLRGRGLSGGHTVLVPLDRVAVNGETPELPTICQNTNGLASGNTAAEATFHGTCELIERDANTLWSLRRPEERRSRCLDPASFEDELVSELVARFEEAGLAIRLFDQTSDLGVPTVFCVTAPADGIVVKHFDVAAGAGTHPHPARAALRAITEAAQTRVTSISGSRDDVRPDTYRLSGSAEAFALLSSTPRGTAPRAIVPVRSTAEALLEGLIGVLQDRGVDDLVAVPLGGEAYGVSVVRMLSDLLEDRGPNLHWKPGRRALDALLAG
jgi:YcaO-like protein with predicted kinase domain